MEVPIRASLSGLLGLKQSDSRKEHWGSVWLESLGERVIAPETGEGTLAWRRVEEGLRGLSRVEAGNPGFPRLVQVTSGGFSWWL